VPAEADKPVPAVSSRKSLGDPDPIISMIDGKPYSTLKRHIARHYYTPESYRAAFDLKPEYPMIAPGYSERRREIAKKLGLGRRAPAAAAPVQEEAPGKKARKPRKAVSEKRSEMNTVE